MLRALLERQSPKILAIDAQDVVGDQAGVSARLLGPERVKVRATVLGQTYRLTIQDNALDGQPLDCRDNRREGMGPILATAGP